MHSPLHDSTSTITDRGNDVIVSWFDHFLTIQLQNCRIAEPNVTKKCQRIAVR